MIVADERENACDRCVSCTGCQNGDCDGGSSPVSHDHCCQSNCWGHTFWVLVVPSSVGHSGQFVDFRTPRNTPPPQIRSDSLYRPPRD